MICDLFANYSQEVAYIIDNMTEKSLILFDELGRGCFCSATTLILPGDSTSNVEGISLAFATAEYLQSSKAYTLFVTHFSQLYDISLPLEILKDFSR